MSPEKLPPEPEKPSAKAAERLAVIVDAAERAALNVIDDAENEAQRYLTEAKARADRIAAERLREVADEIEGSSASLSAAPAGEPRLRQVDPPNGVAPDDEAAVSGEPRGSSGGSAAARLLATQMAVSGSSRKEIEMRLRSGFEIEDAGEILDAILGPEE